MIRKRNILQRAFTLMELMVAIVVLLGIMVAAGRILSSTSAVSAAGRATSELLQQAVAIEQQFREDIEKISPEGFIGIHSVAVVNNVRGDFFLLDDSEPAETIIRCDQLIFFTESVASAMLNRGTTDYAGQGLASMVYYGHGLRFPQLEGMRDHNGDGAVEESDDPILLRTNSEGVITPWYEGPIDVEVRLYPDGMTERFDLEGTTYISNGTQPSSAQWTLCRQAIILGDDDYNASGDDSKKAYMATGVSTHTIFPWDPRIDGVFQGNGPTYTQVMQGRIDLAATQLDDIRQSVLQQVEVVNEPARVWRNPNSADMDQQELIASLFRWPRVEPYPPTTNRYDQILMMHALAEGCVSFKIEWTYDEGVGENTDSNGVWFPGFAYADNWPQPWWGDANRVDPDDPANLDIAFETLREYYENANGDPYDWNDDYEGNDDEDTDVAAPLINYDLIETSFGFDDGNNFVQVPVLNEVGVSEYWAIFGYNADQPFSEDGFTWLNDPSSGWQYTPKPSALRVTLRLLDRKNRMGGAWTYQFVVNIPERE